MKRVLFVIPSYEIGGTVVSVKNLQLLLRDEYDITLMCMSGRGTMRNLYDDVIIARSPYILQALSVPSWRSSNTIFGRFSFACIRFIAKLDFIKELILKLCSIFYLRSSLYDVVIASQEGICTKFVSYSQIQRKLAWVRCDYKRYFDSFGLKSEIDYYNKYFKIICVSEKTTKSFIDCYPFLSSRVLTIYNPQSADYIYNQSLIDDKEERFDRSDFTIVSVGRFNPVKRFDRIPQIASFLKKNGIKFKWYIIGGGSQQVYSDINREIKRYAVQDNVILLGIKSNPHYYISNADLLVSLSESEACPRVINEAKILHTPVVCTNFDTANEYIVSGVDGIISPIESIENEILGIIKNDEQYQSIKLSISQFRFDNSDIISKIIEVIG